MGVPHIKASDWGGLGYGYGYAQAQDNLCTMADSFLTYRGERSQYFGGSALLAYSSTIGQPRNIDSDFFHRHLITQDVLDAMVAQQGESLRKLTEALGYFKDEGLKVELQSQPAGVDAENQLIAGAVQGVVGFYDHTIDLQAKGKEIQAIAVFCKVPGEVELVSSKAAAAGFKTMADAKGKTLFSGLKKANDELVLEGPEPLKFIIGAPMAVNIEYQGKSIDMSRYNNGRTARLSLPQE